MAQRKFAQCLGEFQFEYIGDAKTDDERCIGESGEFFFFFSNKPLVWLNHSEMHFRCLFTVPAPPDYKEQLLARACNL